jgi:hypothetical protein
MSFDALIVDQVANAYVILGAGSAVLAHVEPGTYDPGSGTSTGSVTSTCTTQVKLDGTSLKTLGFKFGDGLVQGGDIDGSIPGKGLTFAPLPGDTLTANGFPYVIVSVRPSYTPGGSAAEYSLLLRK